MTAQQLTLLATAPSLPWTEAARRGLCVRHQDRPGTTYPGDWVTWCEECRREHKRANKEAG